jgi:hypothetical protein
MKIGKVVSKETFAAHCSEIRNAGLCYHSPHQPKGPLSQLYCLLDSVGRLKRVNIKGQPSVDGFCCQLGAKSTSVIIGHWMITCVHIPIQHQYGAVGRAADSNKTVPCKNYRSKNRPNCLPTRQG